MTTLSSSQHPQPVPEPDQDPDEEPINQNDPDNHPVIHLLNQARILRPSWIAVAMHRVNKQFVVEALRILKTVDMINEISA